MSTTLPLDWDGMLPMSLEEAYKAQQKFKNEDLIWGKPKGIRFTDMPNAGPEQKAFFYPDGTSNYFVISLVMQRGYHLKFKGRFPRARYFSYTIANSVGTEGDIGGGQFIRDRQIEPDKGSKNPFRPDVDRNVQKRNYTIHVIQGTNPNPDSNSNTEEDMKNVLYVPDDQIGKRIHLSLRIYLVDEGYDISGTRAELPIASLKTQEQPSNDDDDWITGKELLSLLQITKDGEKPFPIQNWTQAVSKSNDPINAPARLNTRAEVFYNTAYSVFGAFIDDQRQRILRFPPTREAGFTSNPDTVYMLIPFSFQLGEVFMIQGKKPSHPITRCKKTSPIRVPEDPQVEFFSISTAGSPGYGVTYNTIFDEQFPVDEDGNYTVITSWPKNRPSNSIPSNGVIWLSPGNGEGTYVGSRNWVGVICVRFQVPSPNWKESPAKIPLPTIECPDRQDENVMGPYYPKTKYISKKEFESLNMFPNTW
jgi:hypothetical protein